MSRVVLASASAVRRRMLANAGVPITVAPASVDEAEVKQAMGAAGLAAAEVAEALAEVKAQRISPKHPGAIVLGCDQMLELEGAWLDKPPDRTAAAAHLRRLSGKTHHLRCCVVALRDGQRLWHHADSASLTMRPLSEAFIASYLDMVGEAACDSVGGYQLEGLGAQLFTQIRGDFFTILGLPLLPVLDFLRLQGVLPQ